MFEFYKKKKLVPAIADYENDSKDFISFVKI